MAGLFSGNSRVSAVPGLVSETTLGGGGRERAAAGAHAFLSGCYRAGLKWAGDVASELVADWKCSGGEFS